MPRTCNRGKYAPSGRRKYWVDLVLDSAAVDTTAAVARTTNLFVSTLETEAPTLLRIVGSIYIGPQANQGVVVMGYTGIYVRDDFGTSDPAMQPNVPVDVSNGSWLWWKARPMAPIDTSQFSSDSVGYDVDVRVKRKLSMERSLHLVYYSDVAYSAAGNLRALMMAP